MFALVGVLLFSFAFFFWHFVWKRRGLPPGPVPLPLLGNTVAIGLSKCPYAPFQQWARQFGPIYTVWLGEAPVVVVADFQLMRDLFVKEGEAYAGREFMNELMKVCSATRGEELYGVIRTEGDLWKVTRKFALQSMRNLGMGRARLEERYLSDIEAMLGRIRQEIALAAEKDDASGVQLNKHIDRLVGSTINQLLFGHPFSDDQLDDFHLLKHLMDSQTKLLGTVLGKALVGMPSLRHFPPFCWTFANIDSNLSEIFAYIDKSIAKRIAKRRQMGQNGAPDAEAQKDLLTYFLDQMDAEGAPLTDEKETDQQQKQQQQQRHYFK